MNQNMLNNVFQAVSLVLAVGLIVSCTREADEPSRPAEEEKEVVLQAIPEGQDVTTKTLRDESNGAVLWSPSDSISLFYGSGDKGGSKFVGQNTSNAAVTNFTGKINVITGGSDVSASDTYFWG